MSKFIETKNYTYWREWSIVANVSNVMAPEKG